MIPCVRADLVAESPRLAALLLLAEREPWRPSDWSAVPAWATWRAEVGARRRPAGQADALLWCAYCEAEASLSAHFGNALVAAYWLSEADQLLAESGIEAAA